MDKDYGNYEYIDPPIVVGRWDLREFRLPLDLMVKTVLRLDPPQVEVVAIRRCLP